MKYSDSFNRDFNWYLKMRHKFDFDGSNDYSKQSIQIFKRNTGSADYELINEVPFNTFKDQYPTMFDGECVKRFSDGVFADHALSLKSEPIIISDKKGVSGKEAFFQFDSNGVIVPTKHPNLLQTLLKTKGSVNLHIKMYAEDRASGLFPGYEFRAFCIKYRCPPWFKEAVERQKFKYYEKANL